MEYNSTLSAKRMKEFVESGSYRSLIIAEEKMRCIEAGIKHHLRDSEVKRVEFSKYGLVAKFIVQRDYEWDYLELNEYLANLGLLIPVVTLRSDDDLKKLGVFEKVNDYQIPVKSYSIRSKFNKLGEVISSFHADDLASYKDLELEMYLNIFDATQRELEECQDEFATIQKEVLSCPIFRDKRFMQYKYGSISLSEKKEGYKIKEIANQLGMNFLIQYGKPDMNKLHEFILKGTIRQQEVYRYRKDITDNNKDFKFTLMRIEEEQKQLQLLANQTLKASWIGYTKLDR